ncbi:MAG: hypothetical protein B7X41_07640 [Microbacterium sp. 14-71-5]|jgi:Cu+-exporting ATPase|nr:MAG: hypothetical protein B7X41_07640 [Microbacterium sp. 14-71-5]
MAASTTIDPVCGMTVDPSTALSAEVDGKTYFFCSEGCKRAFLADPASFAHAGHDEGGHQHEHGGHHGGQHHG